MALLEIDQLNVQFHGRQGITPALTDVNITLAAGTTTVVLGESGSGKSLMAKSVLGLLPKGAEITSGAIRFDGTDLAAAGDKRLRHIRGNSIGMVFQDALTALNPVTPVGQQIAEVYRIHDRMPRRRARERAIAMMDAVRIPDAARRAKDYPFQFSGGMRQRVMIAMAIAHDPALLIADEPTTALDVTVQAQILDLLQELRRERNMALLLITHDIGVAAQVAEQAVVMYAGRVAEAGAVHELIEDPAHPYTAGLLGSIPRPEHRGGDLPTIQGAPPALGRLPQGCAFHPRCPMATSLCRDSVPARVDLARSHTAWCHHTEEVLRHDRVAAAH